MNVSGVLNGNGQDKDQDDHVDVGDTNKLSNVHVHQGTRHSVLQPTVRRLVASQVILIAFTTARHNGKDVVDGTEPDNRTSDPRNTEACKELAIRSSKVNIVSSFSANGRSQGVVDSNRIVSVEQPLQVDVLGVSKQEDRFRGLKQRSYQMKDIDGSRDLVLEFWLEVVPGAAVGGIVSRFHSFHSTKSMGVSTKGTIIALLFGWDFSNVSHGGCC
mmetsp:Transcript_30586/g.73377  ORF Transcript_30586/g.73377 Transcript_30586/m.73377 type:complete len:216 (-) Transcript_30586:80-727(-)